MKFNRLNATADAEVKPPVAHQTVTSAPSVLKHDPEHHLL
jgi:hypothetical protein